MAEARITVKSSKGFTVVQNDIFNENLSLRAVGLFCKMHSLPDTWDYTVSGLCKICKDGKDSVRAGLRELEAAGYLVRSQAHDSSGRFSSSEYTLYDVPCPPLAENPPTVNPTAVSPSAENPPQLNIYKQNKKEVNTPIAPKGKKVRREPQSAFIPPTFEEVAAYCKNRGNDVDPRKFFDYFHESGWVDAKGNRVRNWKQKIITWEGRNFSAPGQSSNKSSPVKVEEEEGTFWL